ncbi:MAG TPA: GIY-YIG nuclease family protein [Candidatus Nanoarchaeia archaeon]|nr:GIY-YIG nuclease family protein [Candidatus Nanoarchaeia archaeon]
MNYYDSSYTKAEIDSVKDEPGIYLILIKLKNGSRKVVYVGKAEKLKTRLLQHLSSDEPNTCLKNHIKEHIVSVIRAYVSTENDRKNVEFTLYRKYKPECNEVEPEGRLVDINFPEI